MRRLLLLLLLAVAASATKMSQKCQKWNSQHFPYIFYMSFISHFNINTIGHARILKVLQQSWSATLLGQCTCTSFQSYNPDDREMCYCSATLGHQCASISCDRSCRIPMHRGPPLLVIFWQKVSFSTIEIFAPKVRTSGQTNGHI